MVDRHKANTMNSTRNKSLKAHACKRNLPPRGLVIDPLLGKYNTAIEILDNKGNDEAKQNALNSLRFFYTQQETKA